MPTRNGSRRVVPDTCWRIDLPKPMLPTGWAYLRVVPDWGRQKLLGCTPYTDADEAEVRSARSTVLEDALALVHELVTPVAPLPWADLVPVAQLRDRLFAAEPRRHGRQLLLGRSSGRQQGLLPGVPNQLAPQLLGLFAAESFLDSLGTVIAASYPFLRAAPWPFWTPRPQSGEGRSLQQQCGVDSHAVAACGENRGPA